ncbi:hypothetical protein LTR49_025769 [Elasticomyces elasticus]|nr:hypothetical protein LTR49_025769 [Elasticomyces elasticus]
MEKELVDMAWDEKPKEATNEKKAVASWPTSLILKKVASSPLFRVNANSKFYSGLKPSRLRRDNGALPRATIRMHVYKIGLQAVIEPRIRLLTAPISTYKMQGGIANIFVNHDGVQLSSEEEARSSGLYHEQNIDWVVRVLMSGVFYEINALESHFECQLSG